MRSLFKSVLGFAGKPKAQGRSRSKSTSGLNGLGFDRLETRSMLAVMAPALDTPTLTDPEQTVTASPWVPANAGAPRDVIATPGDGFVNLMWRQPTSTGVGSIRNYRVFISEDGGTTWTKVTRPQTTDLSASVTGLTNGKSYSFRLQAMNGYAGFYSDPVSVAPRSSLVRSASPFNLVAQASDGKVTLSWSPPNANSGQVVGYVIRSMPEGGLWTRVVRPDSTDLAATVSSLANGTRYRFKVSAVTANGPTAPSAASVYVRPATVPGMPTALVALGSGGDRTGPGQVVLTWQAPSDGGREIIDYTISWQTTTLISDGLNGGGIYQFGQGTEVVRVEPGATATATLGIHGTNTRYTFYVTARNRVGSGENSAPSNSVYFGDTPFPDGPDYPLPLPVATS
jgi:titin